METGGGGEYRASEGDAKVSAKVVLAPSPGKRAGAWVIYLMGYLA